MRTVVYLIEAGASIQTEANSIFASALTCAASGGKLKIAELILSKGGDPGFADKVRGGTALIEACDNGSHEIVKLLIEHGARVDQTAHDGSTALFVAADAGHTKCVYHLITAGAKVNSTASKSSTALHAAARSNYVDTCECLLSAGANTEARDENGYTAMMSAAELGFPKVVQLLIDCGSDINAVSIDRCTVLTKTTDLPTLKVLIDNGANLEFLAPLGQNALHIAGAYGYSTAVICTLYKAGVNPCALDVRGRTPADLARSHDEEDAAKLLDMLATQYRNKNSA